MRPDGKRTSRGRLRLRWPVVWLVAGLTLTPFAASQAGADVICKNELPQAVAGTGAVWSDEMRKGWIFGGQVSNSQFTDGIISFSPEQQSAAGFLVSQDAVICTDQLDGRHTFSAAHF